MRLFAQKRLNGLCQSALTTTALLVSLIALSTGCRRAADHPLSNVAERDFTRHWRIEALERPGPIFIDPGHGGKDVGAVSRWGQLEKSLNLETAFALQTALAKKRLPTKLSRSCDKAIELQQRARFANAKGSLMLISLHHNWAPNDQAAGIEIFYPRPEFGKERSQLSRALANSILLQLKLNGFSTIRGIKASGFRVLVHSAMPAVLIEGGFLSNALESRQLANSAKRKLMAASIARGIEQFLREIRAPLPPLNRSPTAVSRVQRF